MKELKEFIKWYTKIVKGIYPITNEKYHVLEEKLKTKKMRKSNAGEHTQDERKLALAKYLANSPLKEKLGLSPEKEEVDEHYSDLENYSENKFSRIYANREEIIEKILNFSQKKLI